MKNIIEVRAYLAEHKLSHYGHLRDRIKGFLMNACHFTYSNFKHGVILYIHLDDFSPDWDLDHR